MTTKLQMKRESKSLSIEELAKKALSKVDCGDFRHMILTIKSIEERKKHLCPRPRKSYEWKALALALGCDIKELR